MLKHLTQKTITFCNIYHRKLSHFVTSNTENNHILTLYLSLVPSFWTGSYWGYWIHRLFGFNSILRDIKAL